MFICVGHGAHDHLRSMLRIHDGQKDGASLIASAVHWSHYVHKKYKKLRVALFLHEVTHAVLAAL
jgi:hypothetical protein